MQTELEVRKADIAETFALIRKVHPNKLALQCVNHMGKLKSYPMPEVVVDYGMAGKPFDALLDALHNSECPYVAAFVQALCDEYADKNADELAYYFEERQ